ncbi:MAG: pyrroline-5-carboxylate reductase family protein [Sutterella wadsworthensis]
MADGWIRSGAVKPEQLGAASRRQDVLEARTKGRGMKAFATCEEAARWADVVVVAVKPHLVEGVVKPIRGILGTGSSSRWRWAGSLTSTSPSSSPAHAISRRFPTPPCPSTRAS